MSTVIEILVYVALAGLGGWLMWREVARMRRKYYRDYIRRKRPER